MPLTEAVRIARAPRNGSRPRRAHGRRRCWSVARQLISKQLTSCSEGGRTCAGCIGEMGVGAPPALRHRGQQRGPRRRQGVCNPSVISRLRPRSFSAPYAPARLGSVPKLSILPRGSGLSTPRASGRITPAPSTAPRRCMTPLRAAAGTRAGYGGGRRPVRKPAAAVWVVSQKSSSSTVTCAPSASAFTSMAPCWPSAVTSVRSRVSSWWSA